MRIYKYAVPAMPTDANSFVIQMPIFAKVLDIKPQQSMFGNGLMMWCEVTPDAEPLDRTFRWVPTGAEVPEKHDYIGTFEFDLGLIFHLYRERVVIDNGEVVRVQLDDAEKVT